MDLNSVLRDSTDKMAKCCTLLKEQFSGLRTGKASPALVENISVLYYGSPMRLRDIANISTPEARLIVITPFDPSSLSDIEKGILAKSGSWISFNDEKIGQGRDKVITLLKSNPDLYNEIEALVKEKLDSAN